MLSKKIFKSWRTDICSMAVPYADSVLIQIISYKLRHPKAKHQAISYFKQMGYRCFAAGDSHNDIQMFEIADKGFFINAPIKISSLHPEIESFDSYNDLEEAILKYSIYIDHE